eukprot:GHVP01008488.1.p1 GENE.GHVP01008488.1~~GHVP01008488.1.p1  ORF type:complete len:115 (-),score=6.53 GHVP01008488.1:920-1264(-)
MDNESESISVASSRDRQAIPGESRNNCPWELPLYTPFSASKLQDTRRRWSTVERDLYGILWATQKFAPSFRGQPSITIKTDHGARLNLKEPLNSKLFRCILRLQEYNPKVKKMC